MQGFSVFWSIIAVTLTSGAANCVSMYIILHMAYVESLIFPTVDGFLETMLSTHETWVWHALCLTYAKYVVCSYRQWSIARRLKRILENNCISEEDQQEFKEEHIAKLHQTKHDEGFFSSMRKAFSKILQAFVVVVMYQCLFTVSTSSVLEHVRQNTLSPGTIHLLTWTFVFVVDLPLPGPGFQVFHSFVATGFLNIVAHSLLRPLSLVVSAGDSVWSWIYAHMLLLLVLLYGIARAHQWTPRDTGLQVFLELWCVCEGDEFCTICFGVSIVMYFFAKRWHKWPDPPQLLHRHWKLYRMTLYVFPISSLNTTSGPIYCWLTDRATPSREGVKFLDYQEIKHFWNCVAFAIAITHWVHQHVVQAKLEQAREKKVAEVQERWDEKKKNMSNERVTRQHFDAMWETIKSMKVKKNKFVPLMRKKIQRERLTVIDSHVLNVQRSERLKEQQALAEAILAESIGRATNEQNMLVSKFEKRRSKRSAAYIQRAKLAVVTSWNSASQQLQNTGMMEAPLTPRVQVLPDEHVPTDAPQPLHATPSDAQQTCEEVDLKLVEISHAIRVVIADPQVVVLYGMICVCFLALAVPFQVPFFKLCAGVDYSNWWFNWWSLGFTSSEAEKTLLKCSWPS